MRFLEFHLQFQNKIQTLKKLVGPNILLVLVTFGLFSHFQSRINNLKSKMIANLDINRYYVNYNNRNKRVHNVNLKFAFPSYEYNITVVMMKKSAL